MDRYLQSGDIVRNSSASKEYCIDGLVGTGASCAVYHAHCTDMEGHYTEHLLKEFNPRGFLLHRNDTGSLCLFNEKDQDKFESELQHFKSGAKMQEDVRRTSKLKNKTSNIQSRFSANGTHYIDMTVQEGETYDKITEDSLYQLLRRIISITSVLKEYHQHGLLHLDVKPENIFIFPETDDLVQMFDFDSVVKKDDLSFGRMLSYTTDWAAQEQVLGYLRKDICEATDLFAVGEILFYKLMGRHSYPHERRSFSTIEFDRTAPIFKDVNPKLFPLLSEIFRHTICNTVSMRYSSADALLEALEKASSLAIPNKPFLASHLPGQASFFIGRDRQLQAIHQMLQEHDVLFVSGIGGIGKSELAKQYAYLHAAEYDAVLFAMCTTDLKSMLLDDTQIPIAHFHREEEEKSEAYYSRKMGKLRELCDSRILIIIDNVNDLQDPVLSELLKLNCKLLITTRADAGAWSYPQLIISKLESESDIRCLLDHWYPHTEDSPEAEEAIIAILDFYNGHTLAVELIAKQMQAGRVTPQKMWQKLTSAGLAGAGKERVASRKDDTAKQQSAYDHIRDLFRVSALTEEQIYVLVNLSLIPPSGISAELFQQWCSLESFDTINELVSSGWVREDPQTWTISLHPLIADVTQERLARNYNNCEEFLHSIQNIVVSCFANCSMQEKETVFSVAPFASNRLSKFERLPPFLIHYIQNIAREFFECGNWAVYIHQLEHILSTSLSESDSPLDLVARIYNTMGCIFMGVDMYEHAKECLLKSLNISLDVFEADAEWLAIVYNNLGVLYEKMGQLDRAEEYSLRAVDIWELDDDRNDIRNAVSYGIIADLYGKIGDFEKQYELYEKSLNMYLNCLGESHPKTANAYNNFGACCANNGNLEKAYACHIKALEIYLSIYSANHPEVAMTYEYIGMLFWDQNQFADALEHLNKSLTIRKALYGESHSDIATIYHDLAGTYNEMDQREKAEAYYRKALAMFQELCGDIHPDTARVTKDLGKFYLAENDYEKAAYYFLKTVQVYRIVYGKKHIKLVFSYTRLGEIYIHLGQLKKAEHFFKRALRIPQTERNNNPEDTRKAAQGLRKIREMRATQAP